MSAVEAHVPYYLDDALHQACSLSGLQHLIDEGAGYVILNVVPNKSIYLTELLVMVMSTILGMGVPGVAAYVIVQTVAVPVLIRSCAV